MEKCHGKESQVYLWQEHSGHSAWAHGIVNSVRAAELSRLAEQPLQGRAWRAAGFKCLWCYIEGTFETASSTHSVDEEIQELQKVMCLAKFLHFLPL